VITGPRALFLNVCRARGYAIEDVRACIVREDERTITVDETHPAYPRKRAAPRGLGDMVAGALAAVGITKERVSAAIGRPCKCGERQETLNAIGRTIGIGTGSPFPNSR